MTLTPPSLRVWWSASMTVCVRPTAVRDTPLMPAAGTLGERPWASLYDAIPATITDGGTTRYVPGVRPATRTHGQKAPASRARLAAAAAISVAIVGVSGRSRNAVRRYASAWVFRFV